MSIVYVMKRIIILWGLILFSCKNVSEDFLVTDGLMRSELVKLSLPEQRAVFSTLTPEMKSRLYVFKFNQDMREQKLSMAEKKVLKEIADYYLPDAYYKDSIPQGVENKFIMEMDALGWSEEDIFKYTMVIMTVSEFDAAFSDRN